MQRAFLKFEPILYALQSGRRFLSNRFVTLPIFYANGNPHIGHLYTALLGDATHRWELLKTTSKVLNSELNVAGRHILCGGTDEHGSKVEMAAKSAGRSPKEHCDLYSNRFAEMFRHFNIANTHFTRTTDERHKAAVEHFWKTLMERGHIRKDKYCGWYSSVDECFYKESDTELTANKTKRIAKETLNTVEYVEEENYVFAIEKFQEDLRNWLIKSNVIHPKNFLQIILQQLRFDGSLSISRDARRSKWGIPVPGDDTQTIYVWLDALINYLTVAGYPNTYSSDFIWPPDMQIVGKDILRFHAIYWPAFLMAVDLPLPKRIFVHSHWLVDKVKMSKSVGNVVDPFEISNRLTVDGVRYFLLKQGMPQDDCNFTVLKAISVVNADLVNNLGNLIQRTTVKSINPLQRYPAFDVEVMEHEIKGTGEKLVTELKSLLERVGNCYESQRFYKGIEIIAETLKHANAFFQLNEPWKMSQGPDQSTVLFLAYEACRISSILLQPIIPDFSARALSRFGLKEHERHLGTSQFAGGPSIKLYGRPMGVDEGAMLRRIESEKSENKMAASN